MVNMEIILSTPLETYRTHGRKIWVKREDMCAPEGWPPFSKLRGLYAYLSRRKAQGLRVVGYTETSISMAGWGVAAAADSLGIHAVIFSPQYKVEQPEHALLKYHQHNWENFHAEIIPIQAGRAKVNWYASRKILAERFGSGAEMLPLGIPLEETIKETAREFRTVQPRPATTVCCIGSGTIFAGLIRGWQSGDGKLIGVMSRDGNASRLRQKCLDRSQRITGPLVGEPIPISVVNPGWEYTEPSKVACPFPCHPYYDLKAWQWLEENLEELVSPILFWNIGRSPV